MAIYMASKKMHSADMVVIQPDDRRALEVESELGAESSTLRQRFMS